MNALTAADFAAFFHAVHGVDPFPWQQRLVKDLLEGEGWPSTMALPTASGKTSVMDAAVFALAAEVGQATRRHARRIFFVVDRRVVVDDAFARARKLADALATAKDGVVAQVAERLRSLGDSGKGEVPLHAAIMRGGIYRDDRWTRSPVQPAIIVSTVDQVGSRLLFRGYGVSQKSWPIHAGLVANDSLLVLDEAHCSRPFLDTLGWVARYRGGVWSEQLPATPFTVVSMTATPLGEGRVFTVDAADRANATLGARLAASKPARLVVAKKGDQPFLRQVETEVLAQLATPIVVGAIVNRVAAARALFEALRTKAKNADVVLLTGRVRPSERDELLRKYADRMRATPGREPATRSLVVVATQCIEVGADLDFDALVTECASLDALRQRFGRLSRLGRRSPAPAVIVSREEFTADSADEPIYGTALAATWRWLDANAKEGVVDFGVEALAPLLPTEAAAREALTSPSARAPIVMPSHLDLWAQTAPAPHVSPDPSAYLHGVREQTADVNLVWRADVDPMATDEAAWVEAVALVPPSSGETLSIPLSAARAWLTRANAPLVTDLEGVGELEDPEDEAPSGSPRLVLRWAGPEDEETRFITAKELRPGDTLVLASSEGGCDEFGWNPDSREAVADLGDQQAALRRKAVLRLTPATLRTAKTPLANVTEESLADLPTSEIRQQLSVLAEDPAVPSWMQAVAGFLARQTRPRVQLHPGGSGVVVSSPKPLPAQAGDTEAGDEDDTSSASSVEVELGAHLEHVGTQAREWVRKLGLPAELGESIALAALRHDVGKADPRFQAWLHGGDLLAAARAGAPLAKSAGVARTARALRRAREASGYPRGGRHELVSVRLAEQAWPEGTKADRELVLHLVASHHGHARPFVPVVADEHPVQVRASLEGRLVETSSATGLERLDSGVADRFWRLVRRYGWWGLAWAEAVTRLSDFRASQKEQEER